MTSFAIKQAEFVTSIGAGGTPPAPLPVEIAIVGRSNVGKSSLINHRIFHLGAVRPDVGIHASDSFTVLIEDTVMG